MNRPIPQSCAVKLSAKTEYGCIAMVYLAGHYENGGPVQIRKVAGDQDIPSRFLVQILIELKRAGLVISTRGAAGGYQLARPPQEISLGEVIAVLDGSEADAVCTVPVEGFRGAVYAACGEAQGAHQERLSGISLTDLLDYASGTGEPMWYI